MDGDTYNIDVQTRDCRKCENHRKFKASVKNRIQQIEQKFIKHQARDTTGRSCMERVYIIGQVRGKKKANT